MTPDWQPLDAELAIWRAEGRPLPIWWRDDDAISATPALTRLATLSRRLALPVHIAVVPANADASLGEAVCDTPQLIPIVHGWAHQNHAPPEEKKAEFRGHRTVSKLRAEAAKGLGRLRELVGDRLAPVFVPPWNRAAPELAAELPPLGYRALSTYGPRKAREAAPGLLQVNTHLDPIDWKGTRSLIGPDELIARVTEQLRDRREGRADAGEPYGILTHHLVHDAAIWQFTETLLDRLLDGPAFAAKDLP